MSYKRNKNEIDMDAANEVFRRMDALEKRVADLTKDVKVLKESKGKSPVKKSTTSKTKKEE